MCTSVLLIICLVSVNALINTSTLKHRNIVLDFKLDHMDVSMSSRFKHLKNLFNCGQSEVIHHCLINSEHSSFL